MVIDSAAIDCFGFPTVGGSLSIILIKYSVLMGIYSFNISVNNTVIQKNDQGMSWRVIVCLGGFGFRNIPGSERVVCVILIKSITVV